jgi:hypothetical protein
MLPIVTQCLHYVRRYLRLRIDKTGYCNVRKLDPLPL